MYREGRRTKNRGKLFASVLALAAAVVLGAAIVLALHRPWFASQTTIVQSPAVNTVVSGDEPMNDFEEPLFSVSLPSDWQLTAHTDQHYTWQSSQKVANKQLEIYVDNLPSTMMVNRVLPVVSAGAHVHTLAQVSGNCVDFVKPTPAQAAGADLAASWHGVPFLCDLHNYERDVVGTSSAGAINSVTLTGASTGQHQFFFVFTDRSVSPDYSALYQALQSFSVR